MTTEIKLQRIDPFGQLTLSEAERLAMFLAGEWVPMPVRRMTIEEVKAMYPTSEVADK